MTTVTDQNTAGVATPLERLARVVEKKQIELKWEAMLPHFGYNSPRSAVLRFDPVRARQPSSRCFP
jgi:hypothetical protein